MNEKDLKRANEITAKINQLENFVWVIAPEKTDRGGVGKRKINTYITTKKTFNLFGIRNFGCGRHTEVIDTPNETIEDIADLTIERINKLKQELEEI